MILGKITNTMKYVLEKMYLDQNLFEMEFRLFCGFLVETYLCSKLGKVHSSKEIFFQKSFSNTHRYLVRFQFL